MFYLWKSFDCSSLRQKYQTRQKTQILKTHIWILLTLSCTGWKMKFSIKDFFSLMKKSLTENFIFCAVLVNFNTSSMVSSDDSIHLILRYPPYHFTDMQTKDKISTTQRKLEHRTGVTVQLPASTISNTGKFDINPDFLVTKVVRILILKTKKGDDCRKKSLMKISLFPLSWAYYHYF